MWLLHAETHSLKWLHDAQARAEGYAILSHTWGKEEVSFQDIQNLKSARRLEGYRKIQSTCKQALQDGLRYVWIDTCCIDKKSSAELSEAINSMYAYYKMSRVCYVLLSDVYWTDDRTAESITALLGQSRWFKRGWTLQELLAPPMVQFFARQWQTIGTKSSLALTLAEITRIDIYVLGGKSPRDYSVAQRMSWASGRETTRPEDRAYSLLGIFDVNIPILYGEGSKAFLRLQREIMKNSDDHSLFLWESTFVDRAILAPSPDSFLAAGKIIKINSHEPHPFELTNSGLRITLPVVTIRQRKFLIFNCRYSNDFRGPIGLLVNVHAPFSDSKENHELPRYTISRCLEVIHSCNLGKTSPKACLVVESLPSTTPDHFIATLGSSGNFWFRENEGFSRQFVTKNVHPRAHWNADSNVMEWPKVHRLGTEGFWGFITWERRDTGHIYTQPIDVTLMFKAVYRGGPYLTIATICSSRGISLSDCERWAEELQRPNDSIRLYHFAPGDDYFKDPDQKVVSFKGPGCLSYSAQMEIHFETPVCVVDIALA